jgi:phage/plasmid-like protein (TIGR03299 family)
MHGITNEDTFAFTGSRQKIWHGLGQEIEEGLTAVQAFEKSGLNWSTELLPVFGRGITEEGQEYEVEIPDRMAHVRADTKGILGFVGTDYSPIENMELAEFVDAISQVDQKLHINTCGSLFGGKRVFALVKLPDATVRVGDDVNESYMLCSNGHGGFASFAVYPTSIRVVCNNTLRWSEKDAAKGIKFSHVGGVAEKVEAARVAMGFAIKETEKFNQMVTTLANMDLDKKMLIEYFELVYEDCFGKLPDSEKQPDAYEKLLTKKNKVLDKWLENMEDPRQNVRGIQGTYWAAYNAISQWYDHDRGRQNEEGKTDSQVNSNIFGPNHKAKTGAFRKALALV